MKIASELKHINKEKGEESAEELEYLLKMMAVL